MLYLLLSILCSSMLSLVMRVSEGHVQSKTGMIAMNYLTCILIGGCFIGFGNLLPDHLFCQKTLGMGIINGIFYMAALLLMQYNISHNGIVLPSVFSRMGALLVPLVISIFLFRETPTIIQILGSILAITAILMLNSQNAIGNIGAKKALFFLFLADGMASVMSKIFNEIGSTDLSSNFLFFTFSSAFLLCAVVILWKKERIRLPEIGFGILIGLPNFMGSRFILMALDSIPAVIVYPMRSISSIVIITLAGTLIFKERLTRRQFSAMGIILVALILLNI